MADGLLSWIGGTEDKSDTYAIAPGVVSNNLDLLGEGRVQVRIPSIPSFEPWARLAALGGGPGRGFVWVPQLSDEVLVAFTRNDERDAYVLGGLWNMQDRPPLTVPTDFLVKRTLKTGVAIAPGHEIEFDDLLQSITITSSTKQKITIDPLAIELSNTAGTLKITMDNKTQTISIQAVKKLELKAAQIQIEGVKVEIKGAKIDILGGTECNVKAPMVKLNSP